MTAHTYRSSKPDSWSSPRPHRDASLRRQINGPIQPMPAEPRDWFTWPLRITMIAATLAVSAHAMGWI